VVYLAEARERWRSQSLQTRLPQQQRGISSGAGDLAVSILRFAVLGGWLMLPLVAGCISRPPTVAHVHIGHAITGVHVTPDKQGYMVTARQRADEAISYAALAQSSTDLAAVKQNVALVDHATNSRDDFGVRESLVMAVSHISFAATSDDASANVQRSAPVFAADSARVVERCELIGLLSKDVAGSGSMPDAKVTVDEIVRLARANVYGEEAGDGKQGSTASSYGLQQLRAELDAMIAREKPPYVTVDQWYLFNLVRLPNGKWVFDKLGRGGTIEGYK
jgi:hypothetical protein